MLNGNDSTYIWGNVNIGAINSSYKSWPLIWARIDADTRVSHSTAIRRGRVCSAAFTTESHAKLIEKRPLSIKSEQDLVNFLHRSYVRRQSRRVQCIHWILERWHCVVASNCRQQQRRGGSKIVCLLQLSGKVQTMFTGIPRGKMSSTYNLPVDCGITRLSTGSSQLLFRWQTSDVNAREIRK